MPPVSSTPGLTGGAAARPTNRALRRIIPVERVSEESRSLGRTGLLTRCPPSTAVGRFPWSAHETRSKSQPFVVVTALG